jgi:hypothetical protein
MKGWRLLSHCLVLSIYPYLNFNHIIINKVSPNVFAIYGRSHIKKSNAKKTTILISYDICLNYICAKKINITMELYSRNDWNAFEYLWNLDDLLNIVIPYDWNRFVSHVKSLITIISQMGFFFKKWPWICSLLKLW